MATPSEKLADSLQELQKLQEKALVAIRSQDLSRTHRERLQKAGFIQSVIKGWYIPARPDETAGESTAWYAAFWPFCAAYLNSRFGDSWSLSPEQSLAIHAGNWTVPKQLLVRALTPTNNVTALPYGTSLLDIRASLPTASDTVTLDGQRLFSLPSALIACAPDYFRRNATDARAALSLIRDASEVLEPLLEGGHSTIAGRLAGAFRNIGKDPIADAIIDTMRAASYTVKETDPFDEPSPMAFSNRERSPYVSRIQLTWKTMRQAVLDEFPPAPGIANDKQAYLEQVDDIYVTDAYNSLSIEGYRVSANLIEKVRSGDWNPEDDQEDRQHRDALAARGYWLAFQSVKSSIEKILGGANPGEVVERDHGAWYRELFAPSVTAGILKPADLAGYRNGPVYIRRSMHTPLNRDALRDAMPAFLELLSAETEPAVRVVLGHFIFVYIHPYMDGNGRMGRFLMNAMLASGGYPWTVIPLQRRDDYMAALESASVDGDIGPFARFLAELVREALP
ncbi:MAG TPA: cell filamentation protein Fic [Spongiibacteraceae bacterium]|nr:cell filamentation protein Fic [Spongiibacteraceae bacterium]HCS27198.1 cell filamentation protein Fic [Spongiibacteraceae bacterium]|tara:strand:- start:340 stop:1866 length:1527 start_codon:yes stop_codon:yes gene_type:complete